MASIAAIPRSVASEIEKPFWRINASLLESTVTMTRGRLRLAAVGLAGFFCVRTLFLLPCMPGACYCPHIEASTNTTMTADNITAQRLSDLHTLLAVATECVANLWRDANSGKIDPAEAAAIVNETIANLTNEAR